MIYAHPQYEFGVIALELALDGMRKMIAQFDGQPDLSEGQVHRLKVFKGLVDRYQQVLPHFRTWVAKSNMYDNERLTYDDVAYDNIFALLADDFDPSLDGSTSAMMTEFACAIRELDQKITSPSRLSGLSVMLPAYTIFHHIHHEFYYQRQCQPIPGNVEKGGGQEAAVEPVKE